MSARAERPESLRGRVRRDDTVLAFGVLIVICDDACRVRDVVIFEGGDDDLHPEPKTFAIGDSSRVAAPKKRGRPRKER